MRFIQTLITWVLFSDELKDPVLNPSEDECHKKLFYDLESIQIKLGITQADVDAAFDKAKPPEPQFLCHACDRNYFISTY